MWVDPRFRSKKDRPKAIPRQKFGEKICDIPGQTRPQVRPPSGGGQRSVSPGRPGPSGVQARPGPSGVQARPGPSRAPCPPASSTPRTPAARAPSRPPPCPKTPAPARRPPARPATARPPSAGGQPCPQPARPLPRTPAPRPAPARAPRAPASASPPRQPPPCPPKTPARAARPPSRGASPCSPGRSPARSASPGARSSPSVTTARTIQLPSGGSSGKKVGIPWRSHQERGLRPPSQSIGRMIARARGGPQPSTSSAPCPPPPCPQSPPPCPQPPPPCPQPAPRMSPPRAASPPCPSPLDISSWDMPPQEDYGFGAADMTVCDFGDGAADMTVCDYGGGVGDMTVCDFGDGAADMTVCDFGGGAADQTVCEPPLPCAPGDDPGLCAVVCAAEEQARALGILSPEDTRPTCPPRTVQQRLKSILSRGPKPNRKGPCIRFWDEQIPPTGPTQKIVLLPGDIDPTETTIIEVEAPARPDHDPGIYDEAVGGAPPTCPPPMQDTDEMWFERMERGEPSIPPRPAPMQMPLWLRRRMTGASSPPLVDIGNMAPTFTLRRPCPEDLIQWDDPQDPFSPPPLRGPSPPPACPYFQGKQDPFSPPTLSEYYSSTFNFPPAAQGGPASHAVFTHAQSPETMEPYQSCEPEAEIEELCRRAQEQAQERRRGGPALVDREVLARPSPYNREVVSICKEDHDESDLGLLPDEMQGAEDFFGPPRPPRGASPQRRSGVACGTPGGGIDLQATLGRIRNMREGLEISSLENFFEQGTRAARPPSPPKAEPANPYLERCMARLHGYEMPFEETPRRTGSQLINLEDEPVGQNLRDLLSNIQMPRDPCALRQQSPPRHCSPCPEQGSHYSTARDFDQMLADECDDLAGMQPQFEDFD